MARKSLARRLRDRAVVTAAILSLVGVNAASAAGGPPSFDFNGKNDANTQSPIKHVIVIIGENRTFDHLFATYQPVPGQTVDNLLSKKIIDSTGAHGVNYGLAAQNTASDTASFEIAPSGKAPYVHPPAPGTSYAPLNCYDNIDTAALDGPGCLTTLALAQAADQGLDEESYGFLLTGATGLGSSYPDSRIAGYNALPNGPYPLVTAAPASLYDTYGGSPVHRFYQMWQELDCDVAAATAANPSGCQADLFPWVETSVSSGSNGTPKPTPYVNKEGDIAMGFYNVAKGDAPYFKSLADAYAMSDNFHQSVMGGTGANHIMFGYADALYYAQPDGSPGIPPANQVENPNPENGTNNWYLQDGYSGGTYTNCSDTLQPGVEPITTYLHAIGVPPRCSPGAYYLLNNYNPGYYGNGKVADTTAAGIGPFTLPPTTQPHIGDDLSAHGVSWVYFGERWNQYVTDPIPASNPTGYLYCNICNPFQYSTSTMTNAANRQHHIRDTDELYDAIADGTLPAVSIVKPDTFNDGHPASSKVDLFESFSEKIVEAVQANPQLWQSTAIFITVDEGGGYYDSGYVQPVDYFGDGTSIPLLVVSPYTVGGKVSHEYADHVSITKFIERNWELPAIGPHTRDRLPNPTPSGSAYVPGNIPAIGDLWSMFEF
jgi:phospholipase C